MAAMCGICGEIRFDDRPVSTDVVRDMTGEMQGRGPDGGGMFWQGGGTLGHRRLKIIDLSESASQPMVDNDLGLAIVFNGCIYNHAELRRKLEARGYRFFTRHSDTEVILKAYHAWGEGCVGHFNGMFAFVIRERDSGQVFAARDRLGIKPLYYVAGPEAAGPGFCEPTGPWPAFRFASSLPALLKGGGVDTRIDPVALHHYMTFHSVVPAPYTILRGVRKLPPATTLTIRPDGRMQRKTFWRPIFNPDAEEARYTLEDWQQRVLHELGEAIDRRMIADVPVGVLLSGGLDSSLVVGMLARHGQRNLNTFSIGFESVGGEEGNEFRYSDLIAEHFGTRHHKLKVDSSQSLPALRQCIRAMSEPMVSHDAIGFYLLSQEVARHVKVVQSGQGADEVFAGYHWYPPMLALEKSPQQGGAAQTAPGGGDAVAEQRPRIDDAVAAYAKVFFDRDHDEYARAVSPALVDRDFSLQFVREHFAQRGADRPIDKTLRLDTTVMLVDDPVKRVDNMTMAWGLEARVPFLDHELVELAARIPAELKTGSMEQWKKTGGKHVLKEAARAVIPAGVIDRPKGYFPVPALKYLRGEYLDMVREVLQAPAARNRGLFNRDYLDALLTDPEKHLTPLQGSKLWQAALLEYWLQEQVG